ncbi:MAG: hypothetical protein JWM27_1537 [Gemmatimonadetes bacterium]|jgi:hypothetical protein|nr:hypothetical protein [Gemmatimonadota bacterium]
MSIDVGIPWERYALVCELAGRLADRNDGLFGKTALQKYVYLLQALFGVDCDYDFPLYTYGPFSADLLGDLDTVEGLGGVRVSYLPAVGGYEIAPGEKSALIRHKAAGFLNQAAPKIDQLLADFGGFSAKDLELRATIVYADRDARRRRHPRSEEALVRTVQGIKPHFTTQTIAGAVRELRRKHYVMLD